MMLHFEKETLPNGLRYLSAPMKDTKAVTILLMVAAGSRYEEARTNGVAHFLEHMFFKGTHNRPTTLEITKELDALGADYNAFTGEEYTGFFVRVAADDFSQAYDIITDMLLNPLFVEEEIEREKGVIAEEINMYEDDPSRSVHDHAKHLFYGDTPLGRNIAGTKDVVNKFTRQDFLDFRQKFYQPDNLVVAIAGSGDPAIWRKALATNLGKLEGSADKHFELAKIEQVTPRVRLVTKKTDQAHLVLGVPGISIEDDRRPILGVLRKIFGGTMSSRLFIEVRERRGLAYYIRSGNWYFRDTGVVTASAGVQVGKIDEALRVILDEYRRLCDVPVDEEELERAQKNIRGSMYLGLEDSMSIAEYLAEEELYHGSIEQPDDKVAKIERVTRDQIVDISRALIQPNLMNLTIIGPYDDESRFARILEEATKPA